MKNKKLIIFAIVSNFILSVNLALAAYSYTPMEKIPGFEGEPTDFPNFLLSITKFAIWTIGIAALLMITIGGFWYMTSAGNVSQAETAKRIITDAILGLIIALSAWLLLFVINPDLVKVNIVFKPVAAPQNPPSPTIPLDSSEKPPTGIISWPTSELTPKDSDLRLQLAEIGINVNKSNCTYVNQKNCTSLDGLPININKFKSIKSRIGEFTITGGTEYWLHKSHGPGKPIIDIWPSVPKNQWDNILNKLIQEEGAKKAFCDVGGIIVSCTNPQAHIHVVF